MNQNQDWGMVQAKHTAGTGDQFSTAVTFHGRKFDRIFAAVNAEIKKWKKELLIDPANDLPEVHAFRAITLKDAGIAEEVARIEIDREQIELDHKKACADLEGAKLATALSKVEAKRRTIAARLNECAEGKAAFAREVEKTRQDAMKAVAAHVRKALPELEARGWAALKKSDDDVKAMAAEAGGPLLALIDAATIGLETVDRLRMLAKVPGGGDVTKSPLATEAFNVLYAPAPAQAAAPEAK